MKKILYYTTWCCLLSLYACSSFKKSDAGTGKEKTVTTPVITDKRWQLIELAGNPVADKINGKEPFLLLQKADNRYTGTAGCNGLGGTFSLSDNNRIQFRQGMSTMMACENMAMETGFNQALVTADNYTLKDNILSLNKARMAPLARFRAVEAGAGTQALNGTWELNYISGPRVAFEGLYPHKKPTITFNLPVMKARGTGSCNNYNIAFTLEGNTIKFADPMSTEMACEGNGEAVFFNTLKTVTQYSLSGTTLNFIAGDIAVMRLEKK